MADLSPQQDQLEPIAPLQMDVGVPIGVSPAPDDEAPPAAPAGAAASYPIAHLVVLAERLACKRLFPTQPLEEEELAEIKASAQAIEDWYAPQLSGPWFLWVAFFGAHAAIYGPRVVEERKRQRRSVQRGSAPEPAEEDTWAGGDPPEPSGASDEGGQIG